MKKELLIVFTAVLLFGLVSAEGLAQICIDKTAPSAPANLTISGNASLRLVQWNASVDKPNCGGIFEYVISRSNTTNLTQIEIGRVAGDVLNFTDNESLADGDYNYTVYAIDLVGRNAGASVKNHVGIVEGTISGGRRGSSFHCIVNWSCGNWSECVGGETERVCTDLNYCGTTSMRPLINKSCEVSVQSGNNISVENSTNATSGEGNETNPGFFSAALGAVIGGGATSFLVAGGFILLAAGAFGFVRFRRMKGK